MVSARRYGRIGNGLYQLAAVIGYSYKHNVEFSFPNFTHNQEWNPLLFPHYFNRKWVNGREDVLLSENGHNFQELDFKKEWSDLQVVINGYFQSYKYYDFCMEEVLRVFNFPYEKKSNLCSIHIRRGDYVNHPTRHPVCSPEYYCYAVDLLLRKGYNKFKVYSDDLPYSKILFSDKAMFPECEFEYSEGKTSMFNIADMSSCEHNICANSTFSTWASELNKNPDKIVVVPSEDNWFGKDNKHNVVHDMYRPEWIQISYPQ